MQSSYNVIKNIQILKLDHKEIITNSHFESSSVKYADNLDADDSSTIEEYPEISEAGLIAKDILDKANLESEGILSKANEVIKKAEADGYASGSKKGYNDAYEKALNLANKDAEKIINNANSILFDSKIKYEKYLEEKKGSIIKLSINIAEKILKKEVSSLDSMDNLIYQALDDSKNAKTFIIKTNSIYIESLKSKVDNWKESLGIKCEIFVVADSTIEAGNAIVEKNNGKVEIGINIGLEGIKQALL